MSAIGNYVHYSASGYLQHGISKKGNQKPTLTLWTQIKNDMRNKVQTIYTQNEISKMEALYNEQRKIIRGLTDDKSFAEVQKAIENLIIKKYAGKLEEENLVFNTSTGGILYGGAQNTTSSSSIRNIRGKRKINGQTVENKSAYGAAVWRRFLKAQEILNDIEESDKKNNIKNKLKKAENEFLELVKISIKELKKEGIPVIDKVSGRIDSKRAREIISNINSYLGLSATGALADAIGDFEEYTAAAISLKAQGLGAQAIIDNLENEIKLFGGESKTKPVIKSDMISINKNIAAELAKGKNYTFQDAQGNKYKYFLSESSQKMDASFVYESSNGRQKAAALSIKNYNLHSGHNISLVTNSPLSTFLFNIDNTNYINHFLNILAWHKETPDNLKTMRKVAELGLGYSILYSAASGRGVGKTFGFADVLVVNDTSSKGDVKMYDIGTLINNLVSDANIFKQYAKITPDLSTIKLLNNFISRSPNIGENIQIRLTYLLADVRNFKISASLNPSFLNRK